MISLRQKDLISRMSEAAKAATPGPYEARCKEFSNHAPLELWTDLGWLDELPRDYRSPTIEYLALLEPANVLKLLEVIKVQQKALEHIAPMESRMGCCKFAALAGHRRRHLKEVAREALTRASEILK